MSSLKDKPRWLRMPLAELTNPHKHGPLMTYQDHWWALDEQDNVLFFKTFTSPQCNANRALIERICQGQDSGYVRAVLVPWGFVKFNISDYA